MDAVTTFNINTDIFKAEPVIDQICILGAQITDPDLKDRLRIIDAFIQDIWGQMLTQQFPNGIDRFTEVTPPPALHYEGHGREVPQKLNQL